MSRIQKESKSKWSAQKRWAAQNRDLINKRQRVANLTPKQHESVKKSGRDSYRKFRKQKIAYQTEYRVNHIDEIKEKCRERHKRHLISYKQVIKFAKYHNITTKQAGTALDEYFTDKMFCHVCNRTGLEVLDMGTPGRRGLHLDHIDSDNKNYALSNLQILCWKCNQCKLDLNMSETTIEMLKTKELIRELTNIYYQRKMQSM